MIIYTSNQQFPNTLTLPSVFKPQWLEEDENLCDDDFDNDCQVRLIDKFSNLFKAEHITCP